MQSVSIREAGADEVREQGEGNMEIVLVARNATIEELIDQCARGSLPFSGPNSLYSKVHAMGYNCNSLYEMVIAKETQLKGTKNVTI